MGVDIGIYCTVDKEVLLSDPKNADIDLNYWETLDGNILMSADCCTPYGEYRGHRVYKLPNWIGDVLWLLDDIRDNAFPYIKSVYIRDQCDGALLEATPDNVSLIVRMFCEGKFLGIWNVKGSFRI